jgi:hypothetical protein
MACGFSDFPHGGRNKGPATMIYSGLGFDVFQVFFFKHTIPPNVK